MFRRVLNELRTSFVKSDRITKMLEFTSLPDLLSFVEKYELEHSVTLWKRDSRCIKSVQKASPLKLGKCNQELYYYSITFACSRGGRKFKTQSAGVRNRLTVKNNCPMNIRIKLSPDGQKLQIVSFDEYHNHAIEQDPFNFIPKRKGESEEKKGAEKLGYLKNKEKMQAYLHSNKIGEASSAFESINTAEVPLISDTDDTVSAPPVKSPVVPERHVCVSCEKSFDGFVYECVQCEYRMCSKCDQEGVHSEHYVLRIPADRSKEEVIMVLEKVRQAIEPLELHPPARAKRKRKKIPQTSQSETESDSDDDVAAEPTVEVKLEVESDEDDPLSSLVKPESSDDVTRPTPCTLVRRMPVNTVNQTESHIDLEILPETIKMEPPDEGCPSTSFSAQTTTRAPRHPKMTPAAAQTVPSAHQTVPSDHQTDLTDYQTASGPVKRLAPNLSRGSVMAKKGRPKIFQLDT